MNSEETRIGKVYDLLIGNFIRDGGPYHAPDVIGMLHATEGMTELPNRKRLIELFEAAMPKECKTCYGAAEREAEPGDGGLYFTCPECRRSITLTRTTKEEAR